MIQSRLWARLGNQAFMCAAAIAHAKRMNTTFAFPATTLDRRIWPTYFKNLPIARVATRDYYKEPRHAFDPIPESVDLTIEGYFQSEKYFVNEKQGVSHALGFASPRRHDHVAVHVRRGDFLQYADQFPVLEPEYYFRAVNILFDKGYRKFKIYSDDINWCKSNFGASHYRKLGEFTYSTQRDPLTDIKDMHLASAFIIANSSYSLFAALLRDDNPLVIAPAEDRWYGPKNKNLETFDLMPERFIKL